jgi:hypothetical protein
MVNETLKTLRDPSGVNVEGVEQFEGYEHAHWALRYRWEAVRAGFLTEVTEPHYRGFFGDAAVSIPADASPADVLLRRLGFSLRRLPIARRAYLAWLNHVSGGVSMNMIATKPTRCVGRHEGLGPTERAVRRLAAAVMLPIDRRRGRAPARLPRTPEQAARALGRGAPTGSRQPAAPSD